MEDKQAKAHQEPSKKAYEKPAIVLSLKLETRAGSPLSLPLDDSLDLTGIQGGPQSQ